jgi:signal recognition particle subunit SRP54
MSNLDPKQLEEAAKKLGGNIQGGLPGLGGGLPLGLSGFGKKK